MRREEEVVEINNLCRTKFDKHSLVKLCNPRQRWCVLLCSIDWQRGWDVSFLFAHVGGGLRRLHHSGRVPQYAEPEDRREKASAVWVRPVHWWSVWQRPGALPAAVCQGTSSGHWQRNPPNTAEALHYAALYFQMTSKRLLWQSLNFSTLT